MVCLQFAHFARYVFPDVRAFFGRMTPDGTVIGGSMDLCMYLLRGGVSIVPGVVFDAEGHVRICYASSMEDLAKGMDRIENGLAALVK